MRIGEVEFRNKPLLLAPMEDVTDPSFRYVCKKFGADVVYTEFVSSDGLIRDAHKSLEKLVIYDYERPIGIQLYGHLTDAMVDSAKIAEIKKPDFIDINFGCPVRKIARRGAGAGMLCNIPLMVEMTEAIVKAVKIPVTVKTRLGWDEKSKNIMEIAEKLQDVGIKALTIHGRTRAQLYKGDADWTLIGEVKKNPRINIPIIGNGDIVIPEDAKLAFEKYNVDGIMIGRGAIGAPWIFRDIKEYLITGEKPQPLTVKEKVELATLHFTRSIEVKGERVGVYEMRRHFSNYFKGLKNFKETRLRLVTSTDISEIYEILEEIAEKWGEETD
ncbi:MAG: tRNA dihydrouridine synthase DusB [Bacteroidales bacterium]|nr:tRNA dihydrouridine synthase DusB [Bacteroidales bacterium]